MAVGLIKPGVKRVSVEAETFLGKHCSGRIYPSGEGLEAVCDFCGVKLKASSLEELESLIEAHDGEHEYFIEYLERVADKLCDELERALEGVYVAIHRYEFRMALEVEVGTKFMEISEALGHRFGEYCEEEGLSEDECAEAFEEAYKEEIERLNEEYAKYVAGVLTLPWGAIEVEPREVSGDYDVAGLRVYVHFSTAAPWAHVSEEEFVELIAAFVAALYRLA